MSDFSLFRWFFNFLLEFYINHGSLTFPDKNNIMMEMLCYPGTCIMF